MFSTILSALLLHSLFRLIFKPDNNVLSCGLFGGCFNRPIDETIANKIKALGFFNQSRGEHSCGYFNGENIYKGVLDKKKFTDLIIKDGLILPEAGTNNVFIGHTRQATMGDHTEKNAHPFNIENNIVVAHNGKISNIWDLCYKNDIPYKDIFVDSLGLGYLINKVGYKILNEYKGYAALLVHKFKEPGSLYLYHGASKESEHGIELEERPLFYLETEEGVYVSSMIDALNFIKRKDEVAKSLPTNRIFQVKDGKIKITKIVIDRGKCNVPITYDYSKGYSYHDKSAQRELVSSVLKKYPNPKVKPPLQTSIPLRDKVSATSIRNTVDFNINNHNGTVMNINGIDINKESPVPEQKELLADGITKVVYHRGRYWFRNNKTHWLADGSRVITKSKRVYQTASEVPNDTKSDAYYFYRGVMLKDWSTWNLIKKALEATNTSENEYYYKIKQKLTDSYLHFATAISSYAKYPVCLLDTESVAITTNRNYWFIDGKFFNTSSTPKFSSRDYHCKDGLLIKIKANDDTNDKELLIENHPLMTLPPSKKEELENISLAVEKQINEIAERFAQKYDSYENAVEGLGNEGMTALNFYAQDYITEFMKDKNPTDDKCDEVCRSFINDSFQTNSTIEATITCTYKELKKYILDAIILLDAEQEAKDELPFEPDEQKKNPVMTDKVSLTEDKGFLTLNEPKDKKYTKDWSDMEEEYEEIKNVEKTNEQNETATSYLDSIIDQIDDIYQDVFQLEILDKSSLAEESASILRKKLNEVCVELTNIASKARIPSLTQKLNKITVMV